MAAADPTKHDKLGVADLVGRHPYAYFEYNFSKSGFHFPVTPNKRN
jgi:hypothetical protein